MESTRSLTFTYFIVRVKRSPAFNRGLENQKAPSDEIPIPMKDDIDSSLITPDLGDELSID
jgi:hypothetical protein